MNTEELGKFAETASKLLKEIGVTEAEPKPVHLSIEATDYSDAASAHKALSELEATGGWCQQPARIGVFPSGHVVPDAADGPILHAEAFGENKSWSLRHLGGAWRLTTFTEGGETDEACLAVDETLLASSGELKTLAYRVYWRNGEAGWRPFAACLLGFGSKNSGEENHG